MTLVSHISLPLVVDAVAKASIVLGVTALTALALRRASASARHFVWTLGLLSALAAPLLSAALPRWEVPIVRVRAVVPAPAPQPAAAGVERSAPAFSRSTSSVASTGSPEITTTSGAAIPWGAIALVAWAAGATLVLGRMFLGLAAVLWLSRRTPVVSDAPWLAQAQQLAAGLGLSQVRFLRTGASTMPMAWGIFRSSVLMPADADTWPAHRLRVVLLHELAHVKRRDCLTHLVAQIACAAYWFNPLVWMASRRLRTERERACDDLVLASGTRGSEYADQLLDIARVMRAGRFPAVLAGASLAMAQRSQLEGRLMAILDPSVPRRGLSRARAFAAAVVFALLIVPVAAVQPWAEERAAVKMSDVELTDAQKPSTPAQKPIESYPGQADADNRRNARQQDVIQGQVQGQVQGQIQGQLQGPLQGSIQGVVQGVVGGVQPGVAGQIGAAFGEAIGTAVGQAIGAGVGAGLGAAVGGVHERVVEHEAQDKDTDQDRDEPRKGRAMDPRAVNALMEALKDTDKEVRETAMNALVQMRDPRMFDPLVTALKDSSADIREHAAFGLGQLRDARAADPLSAALKDENAGVREQAVFALGQLRALSAIDAIALAVKDTNPGVREQAVFALGQIRDRRAVDALVSALKDSNPGVREQAAFSLGQIRDAKAIEALVVALKDANSGVREQVAFALGQLRDPRAIDGLTGALKDSNPGVRQQAAFALGQIRY
jgi:HEAT repeat protein/beta-lactamase regulating signal transducer with metallopeptidase domain